MPYTYNQNDIIDLDNENSFHSHNNTYNPFRINLHSVDDEEVEQIKRELVTPQPRNTHSPLTRNYYHYHDKNTHNRTSINSYDQFNSMDNTNESVLLFKNMINGDDSVSVDFVQSDLKDFVGSYPLDDLLSRPASRMPSNNSPVFQHNNDTMERNYHHPSRSTTTSPLNQLGRETLSMENNNDSHGNYNGYYPYGYTQPVQDTRREQGDVSTLLNSNTNRLSGRYSSDTLSPRITPFEPYESKLLSPSFKPFKTASTSQLHHEEKRNQLLSAVERSYRTEAMCNASLSDTTRNYDHRISLIDSNKNKRQSVDSVNLMKLRQDSDDLLERRNSLLKARAHRRLSIIEPINELKELRQLKELKEPAGNSQAINSNTSTDKLSSLYSDHSAESEDLFADNSYHKHRLSPDYISNRNISPTFNRSRAFSLGSSDSSNISYHMDKLDITRTKNEREIPVERVTSPVGRYRKQTSSFNLNYKQAGRVFPEHPAIEEESPNNKHSKLIELANENEIIPQPHASYKHSNTNIPISASQSTGGLSNSTTSSSHSEDIYYDPPTHSSHKILRHHPIDRITSPTSMRQIETQIEKAESRYADYLDRIKRGNNTVLKQRIEAEQDTSAVYRRRRVISEDSQLYKSQVDQDTERSRTYSRLNGKEAEPSLKSEGAEVKESARQVLASIHHRRSMAAKKEELLMSNRNSMASMHSLRNCDSDDVMKGRLTSQGSQGSMDRKYTRDVDKKVYPRRNTINSSQVGERMSMREMRDVESRMGRDDTSRMNSRRRPSISRLNERRQSGSSGDSYPKLSSTSHKLYPVNTAYGDVDRPLRHHTSSFHERLDDMEEPVKYNRSSFIQGRNVQHLDHERDYTEDNNKVYYSRSNLENNSTRPTSPAYVNRYSLPANKYYYD